MKLKSFLKNKLPASVTQYIWLIKHPKILFGKIMPRYNYNEDELITMHSPVFLDDKKFIACYDSAVKETLSDPLIRWRAHIVIWAASRGKNLEGDFVECGVNRGFLSKIVLDYIDFNKLSKTFFLLDTYEGFVEKYLTQEEKKAGKKRVDTNILMRKY